MKKIIISLSIIAVASLVIGGTYAFFSDEETAPGNVFKAGALDLTIDNQCHYNGMMCDVDEKIWVDDPIDNRKPVQTEVIKLGDDCDCSWNFDEWVDGSPLLVMEDVKPGDWGENTLSFHLDNDAWACLVIDNVIDRDNSCTDPEQKSESGQCSDPDGDGELDDSMAYTVWNDPNCNNILEPGEEVIAFDEPVGEAGDPRVVAIADNSGQSLVNGPVSAGTACVGVAWEVELNAGNEVQTDSLGADLKFYVEQARHNDGFMCSEAVAPRPTIGVNFAGYEEPASCSVTVMDGGSIQDAINLPSGNDIICVDSGIYNENVLVNKDVTVVAIYAPDSANRATINGLVDLTADGATFKGFNVVPGEVPAKEAGITSTANNTTIDSNIVSGMSSTAGESIKGIYVYKGSAPAISGNLVTGNYVHSIANSDKATYGVMVQGVVDNTTVVYNTIENLSSAGWFASGVEVTPTSATVYAPKNVVIQYNHIENIQNGTTENGKAVTIDWANPSNTSDASEVTLSYNNFVDTDTDVRNLDAVSAIDAPNNWWGDLTPVTDGNTVNTAPIELSAFPLN